jgi:NADH:ubiquinone oxidoreductase subunit H
MFFSIDWNILEIFMYSYDFIISPQINSWGILTILHLIILKFKNTFCYLLPLFVLKTNVTNALVFAIKFLVLIALLVFVRGGIPRYRYDFLTKVGWIKFLSLILSIFLSSLLLVYLF